MKNGDKVSWIIKGKKVYGHIGRFVKSRDNYLGVPINMWRVIGEDGERWLLKEESLTNEKTV